MPMQERVVASFLKRLGAVTAVAVLAALPFSQAHAEWPKDKPLTVIVPFGPGSSPDQVARVVADKASSILGQTIVVENRPGASGNIGTNAIARAKPDGYTFGVSITGPMVNNTVLYDSLPYDPKKDLVPLTLAVHQPNILVVRADSPIKSVQDLLQALRDNPDKFNFPSTGNGTVSHLSVELMLQRTNSTAVHAPYPSSPQAVTSIVAGDTQFGALPPIAVMPLVRDGRLRALAVTSSQRSSLLPDIPTLGEAGVEGIEGSAWIGFVAPAGIPEDVQQKLTAALREALNDPEVVRVLGNSYMEAVGSTPEEFRQYMDEELERWGPLIKKLGIKL